MKRKKENLILKQKEHPPPVGFEPQPLTVRPNKRYLKWRGRSFLSKCHFFNCCFQFYSDLLQACHLVRIQDFINIFQLILVPSSCYLLLYEKNFIEKAHFTKWNSPDMNFISVSANFKVQIWPVFGTKID